jgi:hypothetical protein
VLLSFHLGKTGRAVVVLFHVCDLSLLQKYLASGHIDNPVRAWKSLEGAVRFSKQTDRRIILRLSGKRFRPLGGHQDQAMISDDPYPVSDVDF